MDLGQIYNDSVKASANARLRLRADGFKFSLSPRSLYQKFSGKIAKRTRAKISRALKMEFLAQAGDQVKQQKISDAFKRVTQAHCGERGKHELRASEIREILKPIFEPSSPCEEPHVVHQDEIENRLQSLLKVVDANNFKTQALENIDFLLSEDIVNHQLIKSKFESFGLGMAIAVLERIERSAMITQDDIAALSKILEPPLEVPDASAFDDLVTFDEKTELESLPKNLVGELTRDKFNSILNSLSSVYLRKGSQLEFNLPETIRISLLTNLDSVSNSPREKLKLLFKTWEGGVNSMKVFSSIRMEISNLSVL